jgi:hypothetical protein
MLSRVFLEHPRSVGETYLEHQRNAFSFAGSMMLAGIACFVHGLVPSLFRQTGSKTVARLHDRMVVNRVRKPEPQSSFYPGP